MHAPPYAPWPSAPVKVHSPSSIAPTPRPSTYAMGQVRSVGQSDVSPNASGGSDGGQTRLQATFEAIKKISSGLASPSPKRALSRGEGGRKDEVQTPGYFDVSVDAVEI